MAFDEFDHDAEAADQASRANEVVQEDAHTDGYEPTEEAPSEAAVAGETAELPDAAAAADTDDIVVVQLVEGAEIDGEPVTHCRIAGVVVEPEGTEVTRSVALLLAEDANVEIVEENE